MTNQLLFLIGTVFFVEMSCAFLIKRTPGVHADADCANLTKRQGGVLSGFDECLSKGKGGGGGAVGGGGGMGETPYTRKNDDNEEKETGFAAGPGVGFAEGMGHGATASSDEEEGGGVRMDANWQQLPIGLYYGRPEGNAARFARDSYSSSIDDANQGNQVLDWGAVDSSESHRLGSSAPDSLHGMAGSLAYSRQEDFALGTNTVTAEVHAQPSSSYYRQKRHITPSSPSFTDNHLMSAQKRSHQDNSLASEKMLKRELKSPSTALFGRPIEASDQ